MTFGDALEKMRQGLFVRVPEWRGNKEIITIRNEEIVWAIVDREEEVWPLTKLKCERLLQTDWEVYKPNNKERID